MAFAPHVNATETTAPPALALRAYPNPFNPQTTLRVDLAKEGALRVVVTDIQGRALRVLADGHHPAGERVLRWDGRDDAGRDLPSGVYLANAVTQQSTAKRKLVLLR